MRTAICVSGLPRFPEGYKSLMDLKHYLHGPTEIDWYFYLWDIKEDKKWISWVKENLNTIEIVSTPTPEFNSELNKEAYEEVIRRRGYFTVKPQNIYCMFHGIDECNKLTKKSPNPYDVVIRTRLDLLYNSHFYFDDLAFKEGRGSHLVVPNNTDQWALWQHTTQQEIFRGRAVNDQFAIAIPAIMDEYANCFSYLDHIILAENGTDKSISAESLLYNHLHNQRVAIQPASIFSFRNIIRYHGTVDDERVFVDDRGTEL